MIVAILSESEADETGIRTLVDAMLGVTTEPPPALLLRSRGWPSVRDVLPSVWNHLYYSTDADGLVVVVDSNSSTVHEGGHDGMAEPPPLCRLCQMRRIMNEAKARATPRPNGQPLHTAVGLAVPAIEAWYLCIGVPNLHPSEAAWINGTRTPPPPYDKRKLKREAYGSDRAGIALMVQQAQEHTRRLAGDLSTLKRNFPGGFGSLANEIRAWGVSSAIDP
jgi:hypothetical protein